MEENISDPKSYWVKLIRHKYWFVENEFKGRLGHGVPLTRGKMIIVHQNLQWNIGNGKNVDFIL